MITAAFAPKARLHGRFRRHDLEMRANATRDRRAGAVQILLGRLERDGSRRVPNMVVAVRRA